MLMRGMQRRSFLRHAERKLIKDLGLGYHKELEENAFIRCPKEMLRSKPLFVSDEYREDFLIPRV